MPASQYEKITSKDVIGMFFQQMEVFQGNSWVSDVANIFGSTQATETYAGLGTSPAMREWLGGKKAKSFREQSVTITNRDFEATLGIKTKDLRRDKTDFLQMRIAQLAERAQAHDAKLLSDLIENGDGTTLASCYDGKALFADNHSVGDSGTVDNKIDSDISAAPTANHGTVTNPSVGEFAHAVLDGVTALTSFKDDQGEPINENARSFLVMVPNALSKIARLSMSQAVVERGESNPLLSDSMSIRIVSNPRLTWTDKFAVFRADGAGKALILQREFAAMLKVLAEGSDHEFKEAEHLYSVEKSGYVGLGAFDKVVRVTLV